MDTSKQIIQYLEELAKVLTDLSVTIPFHILITGGAYMLLHKKRRFTLDIDFALITGRFTLFLSSALVFCMV